MPGLFVDVSRLLDYYSNCEWSMGQFKNGPSEIYERQPLKNLKWYGLLKGALMQIWKYANVFVFIWK